MMGWGCYFRCGWKEGASDLVAFEPRSESQPRRMNEASYTGICGSSLPGKGMCKCEGPRWE